MKRVTGAAAIAILCMCGSVIAQDVEKKVDLYGFADMTLSKFWMEDNSPFQTFGYDKEMSVKLSHVNTYFDFKPNDKTRAMVELSFQAEPVNNSSRYSQTVYAVVRDTSVATGVPVPGLSTITLPGSSTVASKSSGSSGEANSVTRPMDGLSYEWGSFSLERAWMELEVNQYANILAGKFITPAGVWNVDHGSPVILTVKQPFQTGLVPVFPKSQYGIMEQGRVFLGDADMNYSAYLSTGRTTNPDNSKNKATFETAKDVALGGNISFSLPVLSGLKLGASAFTGMQRQAITHRTISIDVTGVSADAAKEAALLVAQGKLAPTDIATHINSAVTKYLVANAASAALDPANHLYEQTVNAKARENVIGFDATLDVKNLSIQSEFNRQVIHNQLITDNLTTTTGFYGLLSYKIGLNDHAKLTPYFMYEQVMQDGADKNAGSYLAGVNTDTPGSVIEGFQSYIGGVNLRLHSNYIVKIEYNQADVKTQGIYNDNQKLFDAGALNIQFSMAF